MAKVNVVKLTTPSLAGVIHQYAGITAPSGYLLCDGSAVSRTTYKDLFNVLVPRLGTIDNITIDGINGVIGKSNHNLFKGDKVFFTTTGSLPTGINANTIYYVADMWGSGSGSYRDVNYFRLATSIANLNAGTYTVFSGTTSGVHTLYRAPYGIGNGTTTFNLPDFRGKVPTGTFGNSSNALFKPLGESGGAESHTHSFSDTSSTTTGNTTFTFSSGLTGSQTRPSTAHTHTVSGTTSGINSAAYPYLTVNYIIKT